ncbi:uncharacterized protein LOC134536150 isoform X2 [Bacillus rossius redtenbacheri]|uniref:uncharacterized protein LOC134536150 isoform X2 n=1 Tax=Bacillus rossius redtenbacheri TaxID=93214 RepID=UPI002FDE4D89
MNCETVFQKCGSVCVETYKLKHPEVEGKFLAGLKQIGALSHARGGAKASLAPRSALISPADGAERHARHEGVRGGGGRGRPVRGAAPGRDPGPVRVRRVRADRRGGRHLDLHGPHRLRRLRPADTLEHVPRLEFRTHVKEVRPVDRNGEQAWRVAVEDSATKEEKVEEFDAVIVCNGHFCTPYIPSIPGIEDFKGVPIHSHVYRNPEIYKERTVIILGANSSGVDICLEVSKYAKLVYLSHNLPPLGVKADGVAQASFPSKTEARKLDKALPCNITQVAGIESFSGGAFVLRDGTKCHADDLIFCTGYEYAFPFLHPSCGVVVKDKMVSPLYQHLIHIDFPTLCFVGLPMSVIPFRVFEYQVTFFLKTLEKSVALPSKEDMRADTERELRDRLARGIPTRHFHRLGDGQWAYLEQLARWAGCPPLPPVVRKIYEKTGELRRGNLLCYKEHKFAITGDDSYEVWR